jgi:hypothetical protein
MMDETSSGARPSLKSLLDQKIQSGLTVEGGLEAVYRTISVMGENKMVDLMSSLIEVETNVYG